MQIDRPLPRQKFYDLIQSIDAAIWEYDLLEDRFTFMSDRAESLLGYPLSDWVSKSFFWRELVHPEDFETVDRICNEAISSLRPCEVEYRLIAADGRVIWIQDSFTVICDEDGRAIATHGFLLDITERKATAAALQASESRHQHIISNIPAAIYQFALTATGAYKLNYASEGFEELFEVPAAAAVADIGVLFTLVAPEDRDGFATSLVETAAHRMPWSWEGRIITPTGKIKWLHGESRPSVTANGELVWDGILTDITAKKEAERDLKFTQFATDNSGDGIVWVRIDGSFAYGNRSICNRLGYTPTEFCTLSVWDIDDSASPQTWPNHVTAIRASSGKLSVESHHHGKNRRRYPVELSLNYFEFEGEEYVFGVVRDVTELRAAQLESQRQKDALSAIVEWTARGKKGDDFYRNCIAYIANNLDISYAFLAHAIDGKLERSRVELLSNGHEFLPAYEIDLTDTPYLATYQQEWGFFPERLQSTFPHSIEISTLQAESYLSVVIRDRQGNILGNIGVIDTKPLPPDTASIQFILQLFADRISAEIDRERDEEELRKSQQQIKAFIDNSSAAMYLKDLDGCYLLVNQTCCDFSRLTATEILGNTDYIFFQPEHAAQVMAIERQLIRSGGHISYEETLTDIHGVERTVLSHKFILNDDEGKAYALGGISTDISDRKQSEQRLQQSYQQLELANQELQRATRLKDEFIATMSHELRTPLNAILGMSEALQDEVFGPLNTQQIDSIQTIEQSGNHLLELINDILDVSKIAAGQLKLNITNTSISNLCYASLAMVKTQAASKQIQIKVNWLREDYHLAIDDRRMRQVIINLLNNAVKFTPQGGTVSLSVTHHPIDNQIQFTIADTGIGIATDDIPKLFQPFIQLDSSLNRKYQGTGLGLVLVKQIVELHQGTVTVTSIPNCGSKFTIALPLPPSPVFSPSRTAAAPPPPVEVNLEKVDRAPLILLAEDNEINIETFSSYLEAKGYRVILAYNGKQAIDLLESHRPDLILMDIQMPEMDGITAIEIIRTRSQYTTLPIIALTALAAPKDRDACLAAGANRYLSKPIRLKDLIQSISELLIPAHA
jgi:PAS domain S-box-containing protein